MNPFRVTQRILARTGRGLWRQRLWALAIPVLILSIGGYTLLNTDPRIEVAGVRSGSGDCADTMMTFVVARSAAVARAAYHCLDPEMAGQMTEEQWVARSGMPTNAVSGPVTRVAEHPTVDGGKIVYYAMDAPRQGSVGYMVYLGPTGLIVKIE